MTKMYIDRATVEQALEALGSSQYPQPRQMAAITNLRAALAQQVEPLNLTDPAIQKRLASQWGYVPAAQAEPVEPVAWMYKAEPWFDGDSWHETYETTTDKTLAYFKDKNARALCFVEK